MGVLLGSSAALGFASVALGLVIGITGLDAEGGFARFTVGVQLLDGIDTVVLIVALFARGEAIDLAAKMRPGNPSPSTSEAKARQSRIGNGPRLHGPAKGPSAAAGLIGA